MEDMGKTSIGSSRQRFDMVDILLSFDGDQELFQEIFEIFVDTYQEQIDKIREAIQSNDPEDVRKAAHSLKGGVSNFQISEITELAFELEEAAPFSRIDSVG